MCEQLFDVSLHWLVMKPGVRMWGYKNCKKIWFAEDAFSAAFIWWLAGYDF